MTLANLNQSNKPGNENPDQKIEGRILSVREKLIREANRDSRDAIVAGMYVMVTASGNIRAGGINLEPEYLAPLLEAEAELRNKVSSMAASFNATKAPVIPLRPSISFCDK